MNVNFVIFIAIDIIINNVCTAAMPRDLTRSGSTLHSWYILYHRASELEEKMH